MAGLRNALKVATYPELTNNSSAKAVSAATSFADLALVVNSALMALAPQIKDSARVANAASMALAPQVEDFAKVANAVSMALAPQAENFAKVANAASMVLAPQVEDFAKVANAASMALAPQAENFAKVANAASMALAPQAENFAKVANAASMALAPQAENFAKVANAASMALAPQAENFAKVANAASMVLAPQVEDFAKVANAASMALAPQVEDFAKVANAASMALAPQAENFAKVANAASMVLAPQVEDFAKVANAASMALAPKTADLASLAHAVSGSLEPLVDAQRTLAQVVVHSLVSPDIGLIVAQNNTIIAKACEDMQAVHYASRMRDISADHFLYPGAFGHVREINDSYGALLDEFTGDVAEFSSEQARQMWLEMIVPSSAVGNFAGALRFEVEQYLETDGTHLAPLSAQQDPRHVLNELLAELNPDFVDMHEGSWQATRSGNPDRLRHAASSQRELIRSVLDQLAPNVKADPSVQRSKRKAQVKTILAGTEADFAGALVDGLPALYDFLSKVAHTTYRNQATVEAALMSGDGLLLLLLSHGKSYDS